MLVLYEQYIKVFKDSKVIIPPITIKINPIIIPFIDKTYGILKIPDPILKKNYFRVNYSFIDQINLAVNNTNMHPLIDP